jgi:hypothetical protein
MCFPLSNNPEINVLNDLTIKIDLKLTGDDFCVLRLAQNKLEGALGFMQYQISKFFTPEGSLNR